MVKEIAFNGGIDVQAKCSVVIFDARPVSSFECEASTIIRRKGIDDRSTSRYNGLPGCKRGGNRKYVRNGENVQKSTDGFLLVSKASAVESEVLYHERQ